MPKNKQQSNPKKSSLFVKMFVAGMILQVLVLFGKFLGFQEFFTQTIVWISNLGSWGPAIFICLYVLATVLFIPGTVLTLGAGALFGVFWGSVWVSLGSTLGATFAFLVGRYFARNWVEKQIEKSQQLKAIDAAVSQEGWKIVGLTRLSPVFPFNLLNYAFGITKVSLKDYFLASWIGMMPATVMYVYFGSLVKDLAAIGSPLASNNATPWSVRAIGLVATIAVTIYTTYIAQKALKSIEKKESNLLE